MGKKVDIAIRAAQKVSPRIREAMERVVSEDRRFSFGEALIEGLQEARDIVTGAEDMRRMIYAAWEFSDQWVAARKDIGRAKKADERLHQFIVHLWMHAPASVQASVAAEIYVQASDEVRDKIRKVVC